MAKNNFVSIIIISFNTKKLTLSCIDSVKKYVDYPHEVIVVDNNSKDGSVNLLARRRDIKLIKNSENLGFAKANNQAIKIAKGDTILLLNSDTYLTNDAVSPSIEYSKSVNAGIVSCKLLNKDLSIQPTGGFFPTLPRIFCWMFGVDDLPFLGNLIKPFHPKATFYGQNTELDWVTGAFFLINRKLIDDIGGLDEDYFMYVEEMDFCYRAKKKGWKVFYLSSESIVHLGGASSKSSFAIENELKNQILFYKKHQSMLSTFLAIWILRSGSLLRGILYAIMGKRDLYETYFKIARSLQ